MVIWVNEQLLRSSRRNASPVELVEGTFMMRQESLAGALVERREIAQTSSRAHGVLPHPPAACDGLAVGPPWAGKQWRRNVPR